MEKHLDMTGIVGAILVDLSKAYDCIPPRSVDSEIRSIHKTLDGFNRIAPRLIDSYLSNRIQRVK